MAAAGRAKQGVSVEQIVKLLDAGYRYLGTQEQMASGDRFEYFGNDDEVLQFHNGSSSPVWSCSRTLWDLHVYRVARCELAHQIIHEEGK
jgi:hypothetical protein